LSEENLLSSMILENIFDVKHIPLPKGKIIDEFKRTRNSAIEAFFLHGLVPVRLRKRRKKRAIAIVGSVWSRANFGGRAPLFSAVRV
jgi:hypothetical protein